MLPFFLLAVATEAPPAPAPRVSAVHQPVQAVVRIVRGAAIRFSEAEQFEESLVREARVRERDGTVRTASLIEFY